MLKRQAFALREGEGFPYRALSAICDKGILDCWTGDDQPK